MTARLSLGGAAHIVFIAVIIIILLSAKFFPKKKKEYKTINHNKLVNLNHSERVRANNGIITNGCSGILSYQSPGIKSDNIWQEVPLDDPKASMFVFNAFYDDRNSSLCQVRIITVSTIRLTDKQSYQSNVDLYCSLHYRKHHGGLRHIYTSEVYSVKHVDVRVYSVRGRDYFQYVVSCKIPPFINKASLRYVSVSSHECRVNNQLPIIYPRKQPNGTVGLCTNSLYGNFGSDPKEAMAFAEWVEIYRMFGVMEIHMYNSMMLNISSDFQKILRYYQSIGVLYVHTLPPPVELFDLSELFHISKTTCRAVNNDCLFRNMYRHKYIVIADLDDIVIPRNKMDYDAVLQNFLEEKHHGKPDFRSITLWARHFPLDFGIPKHQKDPTISTKYVRYVPHFEHIWNRKALTSPRHCDTVGNHACQTCPYDQEWCSSRVHKTVQFPQDHMVIHHYRRRCSQGHEVNSQGERKRNEARDSKCEVALKTYLTDTYMYKYRHTLLTRIGDVLKKAGISSDLSSY